MQAQQVLILRIGEDQRDITGDRTGLGTRPRPDSQGNKGAENSGGESHCFLPLAIVH